MLAGRECDPSAARRAWIDCNEDPTLDERAVTHRASGVTIGWNGSAGKWAEV